MNYMYIKRLIDLLVSLTVIFIISPIFLIIGIIIKVESKGSAFYKAERSGLNGINFTILKFRTMYSNSDLSKMTTSSNDDRITGFGYYLRKYKIDELPQLINVLLGHMSLVGPRPELPFYTSQYSKEEEKILSVRPGITDFASIEFYNLSSLVPDQNSNDFFESQILTKKNKLRLKYIREISLLTDCKIFFLTMIKIFKLLLKK